MTISIFNPDSINNELSKPTSIFGLKLWVVIGILLGSLIVITLFFLSLCLTSRRRHRKLRHADFASAAVATPPISKEIQEIVRPPAQDHYHPTQPVAAEIQVDIGKTEHRVVFSDRVSSGESRGTVSASETASYSGSGCVELIDDHHLSKKTKKKKHSAKGKVLLRALYGVKVKTLYIFSVFAAAFSGSSKNLFYLTVPKEMEELPWAQAFMELQNAVNPEIKNTLLSDRFTVIKDLEAVESGVKKLYTEVQEGPVPILLVELLKKSVIELSERFDLVSEETRCLLKIVISARDALFESLWTKYAEDLGVTLPIMIKSVKTCL